MAEDELQTCNWLEDRAREVARVYLRAGCRERMKSNARSAILLANNPMHAT
jgi:hypothetical protein